MATYAGVDGCRQGWFGLALDEAGVPSHYVARTFPELLAHWSEARAILVDIPIGLPDSPDPRRCDVEARSLLGDRRSSVFPAPCRAAFGAGTHARASELNHAVSGRRLTIQTWAILPKIREVDRALRDHPGARSMVREVHPELLFRALNGGTAMAFPKRRARGREERIRALERHLPDIRSWIDALRRQHRRADVRTDDILDAAAAAVTALRGGGEYRTCPAVPDRDRFGLPMEMVYWWPERDAGTGGRRRRTGQNRGGRWNRCTSS